MKTFPCLLGLAATVTASAQSDLEAMLNYVGSTSGALTPIYSVQPGPVGWTFQPLTDIDVTALGAWAYAMPSRGGLEVGLWNAGGTLLASSTITASSVPVDQSLYATITPVMLLAGQTYYLGAYSPAGAFQCVAVDPNDPPNGSATMASEIQLGSVAYETNSGFAFPDITENLPGSAIVAPNFEFQVVPEPVGLLAAGCGVLAWVAARRRTPVSPGS
jgi:hypothetical protein